MLLIPQLALAPNWSVLGLPSATVQQKSYVGLTREQYLKAHTAMIERTAVA